MADRRPQHPPDDHHNESKEEDRLVSAWKHEQAKIAAQVRVDPDPIDPPPGHERVGNRFFLVPNRSLVPVEWHLFGGVDVSFVNGPTDIGDGANRYESSTPVSSVEDDPTAVAVYVVWDARTASVAYQDHEYFQLSVPYVPSFLAFREIEPLVRLVQKQQRTHPDLTPHVVLVDGNGILHPRRAGIACFLGVRTGLPTIGVGKSLYNEGGLTKEAVMKALDGSMKSAADALQAEGPAAGARTDGSSNVMFDSHAVRGGVASTMKNDEHYADAMDEPSHDQVDRTTALTMLAAHCQGLAVPLCCVDHDGAVDVTSPSFLDPNPLPGQPALACAMVGHGGRIRRMARPNGVTGSVPNRSIGSAKPIFVSVGHRVSLSTAVAICASLSTSRIPEPVRQADLIGRELIRQHQSKVSESVNHGR